MNLLIISNILLWILFLTMAFIIYALIRQIGVLYERVAPAGALAVNQELEVGQTAPEMSIPTIDGNMLQIGGKNPEGRSQLLFFISPDCPICKTLLPALKSSARAESGWISMVLASDGNEQDHSGFIKRYTLHSFPYVISELLGKTYGVSKLPYAVVIDELGAIASYGIINSREHLDSLFEAKERKVASIQQYLENTQDDKIQ